uniref:Uncharacterized protein n=1 Tax=Odontella aurita TaxID=265563 RepID=A0A7S4JQM5_9STRA|mmetsp:Transcript_5169/g.14892  ORF Transcript_5169/g.14892 Transcript_5169/m.14892 type:complete len:157 (+) Transcript_5169:1198-1668(+)
MERANSKRDGRCQINLEEGARAAKQQQRRIVRMKIKLKRRQDEVIKIRDEKKENGLFLFSERCEATDRFCRGEFLSEESLDSHERKRMNDFPVGMRSRDRMAIIAPQPGGILAADGYRKNRLNTPLYLPIEADAGALGLERAICRGKFNRKGKNDA